MSRTIILQERDIIYNPNPAESLAGNITLMVPPPFVKIEFHMFGNNRAVAYLRVLQHVLFDAHCLDAVYSKVYLDKEELNREYLERYGELLIDDTDPSKRGLFQEGTR